MKHPRLLRWLFWLALPLLLVILLSILPLGEVWAVLASISPLALASLVVFNALVMVLFSSRWWLALRAQGQRLSYLAIFRYRMAAFAISYFTPGTQFGGEPLQVYTVSSRHAVPAAPALASVTLDKLFELLANFTFLVIGVVVILRKQLFSDLASGQGGVWAVSLLALPLAYLILLWSGRSPLPWLIERIAARLPSKVSSRLNARMILDVVQTAEAQIYDLFHQKPVAILWMVGASMLIWLASLAEYWLALRMLGAHLDLWQAVAALTVSRLAFLTPLPGGLGALEAGQILALQAMGFDPAMGVAISLWIRVRDTALGLLGLWWGAGLIPKPSGWFKPSAHPLPTRVGD